MKTEFIRKSGVSDIKFTEVEDINLYIIGPIGKTESVRTALDLIKDQAIARGSMPG